MTPEEHYAEAERLIGAGRGVVRAIALVPGSGDDSVRERRRDALGKQAMGIWAQAQVHATLALFANSVPVEPVRTADHFTEIEWDRQRVRPASVAAEVRLRDGDNCRFCGVIVNWLSRYGARVGCFVQLGSRPLDTVVACAACKRRGNCWTPNPAPAQPFYSSVTTRFLMSHGLLHAGAVRVDDRDVHVRVDADGDVAAAVGEVEGEPADRVVVPVGSVALSDAQRLLNVTDDAVTVVLGMEPEFAPGIVNQDGHGSPYVDGSEDHSVGTPAAVVTPDTAAAGNTSSPAAGPADLAAVRSPAAAATPDVVAAGPDRRESLRLCPAHFDQLATRVCARGIVGADPLLMTAQDAVVGCAAFIAGDQAAEMIASDCPLCFLVGQSARPNVYERLLDIAAAHVLERAES